MGSEQQGACGATILQCQESTCPEDSQQLFQPAVNIPRNRKTHPEIHRVPETVKVILKKNKAGGLTRPDFKTFYKAAVWFLHKDR